MSDPKEPVVVETSEEAEKNTAADEGLLPDVVSLEEIERGDQDLPGLALDPDKDDVDPAADNLAGQDEENMYGNL